MNEISIEDFMKLDLRIVEVTKSRRIPSKSRILIVEVDLGNGETREIVVGGGEFYEPEFFIGRKMVLLGNLQPKIIAGIESRGMLLAADFMKRPYWLQVEKSVPPGSKVH
ncbi:MAG: tRNA-binding protein [Candidatus Bathyarchaeota archaeon]|nr:MAG: tRNA-binding protein [Candidatus Bathyarchaeota archaeon]